MNPKRSKILLDMVDIVAIVPNIDILDGSRVRKKLLKDEQKTLLAIQRITLQRLRDIDKELAEIERTAAAVERKMITESLEQVA